MAKDRHKERSALSRYGPISTRTQATQTLPLQTQPPTQLLSHEVHQYTQIIHHDPAEHVRGDTLVNDSDVESSGDTVVLNDDDDGEPHGDVDSGPNDKGHVIRSCENGLHGAPHIHSDLPDSDATTEEGNVENAGYLDTDAESHPPHIDAPLGNEGVTTDENLRVFPEVEGGNKNLTRQETPQAALVADTNGTKDSQSRPRSISSVRAASLRASGLRAAGRSTSLSSAGKDDVKFDSEATIELTPGTLNDEPTKVFEGFEAELHGNEHVCIIKETNFDSIQSSPKITVPFDDALARSPHMSTSRSKSKSVSPTHSSLPHALGLTDNAPSEQGSRNHIDSDATTVLKEPKAGSDHTGNLSAPLEPLSLSLKRLHSQASIVSPKTLEHEVGSGEARPSVVDPNGQPSSQKARKLVFDYTGTLPNDKLGRAEENAVSKVLHTDHSSVLSKQLSGIHSPLRERQGSLPSGIRAASVNLSYLESQEPGEESQLNALNVVDKLVWLDASCMPDDGATSPVPQDCSVKSHAGVKGLQSLAQAAQMKAVHDKLDVFDWKDSQLDEDSSPEKKQGPANVKLRKRQLEAHKLTMSSKKQAISHHQKTEVIPPVSEKRGPKSTFDVGKAEVPKVEPSRNDQEMRLQDPEMKPHTLLTTRLRDRTKAEAMLSTKGKQSPGLLKGQRKRNGMQMQIKESSKELETEQQRAGINMERQVQQAAPEPRRRAGGKKVIDGLGRAVRQNERGKQGNGEPVKKSELDTKLQANLGLADRTSQDDAAADIWIEAFSHTKNKSPMDRNVDLIKFKKRGALPDDTRQDVKKYRTVEPATVDRDDERAAMSEQEEVSRKEDMVEPGFKPQQYLNKSKLIDAASSAQNRNRRVSTRLSNGEHRNLEKHGSEEELIGRRVNMKQTIKKSRISKDSQPKGSALRIQQKHQVYSRKGNLPESDEAERESKREQEAKQNETADVTAKSRKFSSHGSEVEHVDAPEHADKAVEGAMLERGPKTRSQAQDVKSQVLRSDGKKYSGSGNAASKSTQGTANKEIGPSLSGEAMQAELDTKKPSTKAGRLRNKESLLSHQHSMDEFTGQEAEPKLLAPASGDGTEEAPAGAGGSMGSNRGEAADGSIPESAKAPTGPKGSKKRRDANAPNSAREDSVPQPGEWDTNKEESRCQEGDVSGTLRRTRSSTNKGGVQKDGAVDTVKKAQAQGDSTTEEQTPKDQLVKSATRTSKQLSRQGKKTKASRVLEKLSSSCVVDEGRRRKRESGEIRVLFSHSLTKDAIKHQKKILEKLGGQLATSALECTHFVSNGFVRSQNMLISMAAGKIVATTLWLESCGQAHYFVDEKNYLLQDEKKEKELGFSMITSLAAARRKPLFKDVNVLICSNTTPEPKALKAIVESAGGQIMDAKTCLSQSDKESNKPLIVIANEKGLDSCSPFLAKGLKVYSEELVLHGVVTQTLDFSRNRLFEDFKQQRGSRRVMNSNSSA